MEMIAAVLFLALFSLGFALGRKTAPRTVQVNPDSAPVRAMPLEALSLQRERAQRTIGKLRKILEDFPVERDGHWYNAVETMRAMGSGRSYLMIELCLEPADPLYEWVYEHTIPDDEHLRVDNRFWSNIDPLYAAMPAQRRVWTARLKMLEARLLEYDCELAERDAKLAALASAGRVERQKLIERYQFRIAEQEAELLCEVDEPDHPAQARAATTDD